MTLLLSPQYSKSRSKSRCLHRCLRVTAPIVLGAAALFLGDVAIAFNPAEPSGYSKSPLLISQAITAPASPLTPPPLPTSAPQPFSPVPSGITDLSRGDAPIVGVGQLRPLNVEPLLRDDVSWLQSVALPLYASAGGDHWGWIYQGWLILNGQAPLAIGRDAGFGMVRPYDNLRTFPVLEIRPDGWARVQYTPGGSAWVHTSLLNLGQMPLTIETWADRLEAQKVVYFLDSKRTQALRSQPEATNNILSLVATDSLIELLAFDGDWMQVRVTRPTTASCQPLTGATVTEGWMRWRGNAQQSLIWYRPSPRCAQTR